MLFNQLPTMLADLVKIWQKFEFVFPFILGTTATKYILQKGNQIQSN